MCSSPFLDRCLNRLGSAHRSPRRPPPTIANQPNAASSTAHCSPTSPSTAKRTPHISAEVTVSVLAHTSIDAPAHVTAETKLPHHQAGQASIFLFYVEAMERCGNRRKRVERLVSAWSQGICEDAEPEGEADDPRIGASEEPKKRSRTRLTDTEVDAMRTALSDGLSVTAVARRFGVHRGTVWAKTHRR